MISNSFSGNLISLSSFVWLSVPLCSARTAAIKWFSDRNARLGRIAVIVCKKTLNELAKSCKQLFPLVTFKKNKREINYKTGKCLYRKQRVIWPTVKFNTDTLFKEKFNKSLFGSCYIFQTSKIIETGSNSKPLLNLYTITILLQKILPIKYDFLISTSCNHPVQCMSPHR